MEKHWLLENVFSEYPNLYAIPQRVAVEPLLTRGFRVAARDLEISTNEFENFGERFGVLPLVVVSELPIDPVRGEEFRRGVLWVAKFQWAQPDASEIHKRKRSTAYLLRPDEPSEGLYVRVRKSRLATPYGGIPLDERLYEQVISWPGRLSVRRVGELTIQANFLDMLEQGPMVLRRDGGYITHIVKRTDESGSRRYR